MINGTGETRRGVLLAGGWGRRLFPLTAAVSKQLLPVYDKPLVYYPLSVLMLAGIREIAVATAPEQAPAFRRLLGDGSGWGLRFSYLEQSQPKGLAAALLLAREFLAGGPCCLALGDNILYGQELTRLLRRLAELKEGAGVFGHYTAEPERYGVVTLDDGGRAVAIEEKPAHPRSPWAVPGFYFFDGEACAMAADLQPSGRGELEITDLNRLYLERGLLHVELLGRGVSWMDAGTPDALAEATELVRAVQRRQGLMIACPEEIAWRQSWIGVDELRASAARHGLTAYGAYLQRLADQG